MSKKEISSGTEKAENLARKGADKPKTAQKSKSVSAKKPVKQTKTDTPVKEEKAVKSKKTTTKKPVKQVKAKQKKNRPAKAISEKRRKKIEAREQKKLEMAKIKAEKKQKRLEKKLDAKQKKLDKIAAVKQAKAERKAKRNERRDLLKHESKEQRLNRIKEERAAKAEAQKAKREAALADKRAKREHRLKVRAQKRAEKNDKRHAPGFGGWLAAVISLGVTTLALGTMLTFGWINMNGMQADMADVHTQSLYELNSIVDNLDTNLAKARVSNSKNEQVRILSDIAVESEMAEVVLERLPVDIQLAQNMTDFVNKMGDSAQSMLYAVASGKTLSESQIATIEHMYKTNLQMKQIINELTANADGKDMIAAMRGKDGNLLSTTFDTIQNTTVEVPKEIHDGPFAENIDKVSAKNLDGLEEITPSRAEELAKQYFNDYGVYGARCTGETEAEQLNLYNVTLMTRKGEMSAQISKQGGKVVEFNSYKDCSDHNFSVERCIDIAEDFLEELGYDDMEAVWVSENGTTCNLNFAYEDDDVIVYSDMIKVKVCEERGIVTGMEALSYVLNHTDRNIPTARISTSEAKANLSEGFEIEGSRLCIVPVDGSETLCYEFVGSFDNHTYYIYVDAKTGDEVQVFTVIGTAQGKALM